MINRLNGPEGSGLSEKEVILSLVTSNDRRQNIFSL